MHLLVFIHGVSGPAACSHPPSRKPVLAESPADMKSTMAWADMPDWCMQAVYSAALV